jgi:hypothetical protein
VDRVRAGSHLNAHAQHHGYRQNYTCADDFLSSTDHDDQLAFLR